jgi:hypothetical protein
MNIKILKEDKVFSQYIRSRDKRCVRCGSIVRFNEKGLPITHECSHYWSRGNWNTRLDEENADTLCFACHRKWGGDYREEYTAFKKKQLGIKKFRDLELRKRIIGNKRKTLLWAYPHYKEKLKKLTSIILIS